MQQITAAELRQALRDDTSIQLIDVREPYEHEEFNIGGTNIPLAELAHHLDEVKALAEKGKLVLYCRSGSRSSMAQKMLAMQFGIEQTLNLSGGVIAWKEEV